MIDDWAATNKTMFENLRCPACMDEETESKVTVYWVTHNKGVAVLQCACTRGHEFTESIPGTPEVSGQ